MPAFRKFLETVGERNGKRFLRLTVVGEHIDYAVAHAMFVCKVERVEDADPLLSMTPYMVVQHFNAIAYESAIESDERTHTTTDKTADRAMARAVATFVLNPEICRLLMPHVVKHCNIVESIGQLDREEPTP